VSGEVDGVVLEVGDTLIGKVDDILAGETSKWNVLQNNLDGEEILNHLSNTNNPHDTNIGNLTDTNISNPSVGDFLIHDGSDWENRQATKTDVGLNNVQNYGIASQAEAEAGVVDNKYMTPLKVKQKIDKPQAIRKFTDTVSMEYNATDNSINFIIPEGE